MDILYCASWRLARRSAEADRLAAMLPSGIYRLLLALAVIAAIVGLVDRAANTTPDARVFASTTVPSHLEASK